jgi:hypothetical protein
MRDTVQIKALPRSYFLQHSIEIPSWVWRQGSFRFKPTPFAPTSERLTKTIIDPSKQMRAYASWRSDPTMFDGSIYFCASEPNDQYAAYFAVHLVQLWLKHTEKTNRVPYVRWVTCQAPDWHIGRSIIEDSAPCELLIISNLTPNSSRSRLERVRDLTLACSSIPVILVIAGEDPISFGTQRLHLPVNALFFHSGQLIKRQVEVI